MSDSQALRTVNAFEWISHGTHATIWHSFCKKLAKSVRRPENPPKPFEFSLRFRQRFSKRNFGRRLRSVPAATSCSAASSCSNIWTTTNSFFNNLETSKRFWKSAARFRRKRASSEAAHLSCQSSTRKPISKVISFIRASPQNWTAGRVFVLWKRYRIFWQVFVRNYWIIKRLYFFFQMPLPTVRLVSSFLDFIKRKFHKQLIFFLAWKQSYMAPRFTDY